MHLLTDLEEIKQESPLLRAMVKRKRAHEVKNTTRSTIIEQDVSSGDMKVARRFITTLLDDIYEDAIEKTAFRRTLEQIRRVLREILKTREVPDNLSKLTSMVHIELKK